MKTALAKIPAGMGAVLDEKLANCDLSAASLPSGDCYIITFDPSAQNIAMLGPINGQHGLVAVTTEGILIDAQTGGEIFAWKQAPVG